MQSTAARLALVAGTLAAIVALFFVLRGGGDDDSSTATTATRSQTSADAKRSAKAEHKKSAKASVPTIVLRNGRPVGGVKTLDFDKGDRIRFAVKPDVEGEIHVHGYNLTKHGRPGHKTIFSFDARLEGVFTVEDHGSDKEVARIKVSP